MRKPPSPELVSLYSHCTKRLGSGETGTVYRFCMDKDCKNCFAVKYASYAEDEVNRLRLIELVSRNSVYRNHVNLILKAYPLNSVDYLIVLEQLKGASSKISTLAHAFSSFTLHEFQICLIQIFATLAFLHDHAEDFVHMDLHLDNIFISAWPGASERLPTSLGTFALSSTRFYPILIDYGHSSTTSDPNLQLWGPKSKYANCVSPSYDIYKLLVLHLYPLAKGSVKVFLQDLILQCFRGVLPESYIDKSTQTIYAKGCSLLPPLTYVDVLRCRAFESFLK